MKCTSMINLHREIPDLNFAEAFKSTNSGKKYNIASVVYDDGLYKFCLQGSTIEGLETKTIKNYFTYGIVIELTFSDNLFSTSLHALALKQIYKGIRHIVLQHTATQMIEKLGLHECLVYGILSPQQFSILKPYKMLQPRIERTTKLFVNKNGSIVTYEPPFYTDSWGLLKKLQKEVIRQLCHPLLARENIDD